MHKPKIVDFQINCEQNFVKRDIIVAKSNTGSVARFLTTHVLRLSGTTYDDIRKNFRTYKNEDGRTVVLLDWCGLEPSRLEDLGFQMEGRHASRRNTKIALAATSLVLAGTTGYMINRMRKRALKFVYLGGHVYLKSHAGDAPPKHVKIIPTFAHDEYMLYSGTDFISGGDFKGRSSISESFAPTRVTFANNTSYFGPNAQLVGETIHIIPAAPFTDSFPIIFNQPEDFFAACRKRHKICGYLDSNYGIVYRFGKLIFLYNNDNKLDYDYCLQTAQQALVTLEDYPVQIYTRNIRSFIEKVEADNDIYKISSGNQEKKLYQRAKGDLLWDLNTKDWIKVNRFLQEPLIPGFSALKVTMTDHLVIVGSKYQYVISDEAEASIDTKYKIARLLPVNYKFAKFDLPSFTVPILSLSNAQIYVHTLIIKNEKDFRDFENQMDPGQNWLCLILCDNAFFWASAYMSQLSVFGFGVHPDWVSGSFTEFKDLNTFKIMNVVQKSSFFPFSYRPYESFDFDTM